MLVCARVPHGGRGGHNWHSYLCVPAGSLSSRQSESWQRERQAFPIPHPSLLFFFSSRPVTRRRRDLRVCVCVLVIVCVCACVFWISVLLHNKSLLNKCKADGTVVSPPWGEKEREKEREKRRKKEEQGKKKTCTPTPYSHPPQTHWSCTLHRRWLCRAAKHLILEWKLKVASESLTDTQTHSVHEREHFVYQKALSSVPVDTNDRADIFFLLLLFCPNAHEEDVTGPRAALKQG